MSLKIKVCGLCSFEQIITLDKSGVDYCGLIFHKDSPRCCKGRGLEAALSGMKLECALVGVFVDETAENILKMTEAFGLNAVQLCGSESPVTCLELQRAAIVIKVFHVYDQFDFSSTKEFENCCDYFLFDNRSEKYGGSGKKFDWQILQSALIKKPFFLSGGISAQDAQAILNLNIPSLYGVDINSRFEISPGDKNIPMVQKFYEQIKQI